MATQPGPKAAVTGMVAILLMHRRAFSSAAQLLLRLGEPPKTAVTNAH
jgi:hypothetical protein